MILIYKRMTCLKEEIKNVRSSEYDIIYFVILYRFIEFNSIKRKRGIGEYSSMSSLSIRARAV